MKIPSLRPVAAVESAAAIQNARSVTESSGGTDRASLSRTANWLSGLRSKAASFPEVRTDAVLQAKADIGSGALESDDNLSSLVSTLLMEL